MSVLAVALLVAGSLACQKKEPGKALNDLVAPGTTAAAQVAKAQVPPQGVPAAALAVQPGASQGADEKLALRPFEPRERPEMATPAGGEAEAVVDDPERPRPGELLVRPASAITIAPDNGPDISTLDPNVPLNMNPGEPEWIEEIEENIVKTHRIEVPRGADVGPDVDLSDPATPASSLFPAFDEGNGTRSLDPLQTGFQSYPSGSPTGGPPDVCLTVGKDYLIAGYNSYYAVYNKGTGALSASFNMTSLFSGLANCSAGNVCDPQVLYDDFNGGSCPSPTDPRYILVALWVNSGATDSRICIACSKSGLAPTSTANFWKYEFDPAGTGVADYPKIGVGTNELIIGHNWFGSGYAAAVAIQKANLYAGTTPTTSEYTFSPTSTYRTPWPATRVGCKQAQTPTYSGVHLTTLQGTSLQLWRWPTPAYSNTPVTYGSAILSATSCTNPTGTYITDQPIDCMYGQWMDPEQRGDFLFAVRGSTGGAGAAMQWAKINVSGASPTVTVNGTVSESGNFLWMGGIASDRDYDFALAFTRASQTNSIRAGAAVAGNQAGTFGSVLVAKDGEAAYNNGVFQNGSYRWGDYTGFAPDPEDGCTLWANIEYARTYAGIQDASFIRPYKFSVCSAAPQAFVDNLSYTCYSTVKGSIIDMGGTPTNAVYHSTSGGSYPGTITGGPNTFTVTPVTIAQLGASNGDSVYLTFTGSDAASHSSTNATVRCVQKVCVSSVSALSGGCDSDGYMDTGETLNVFVNMINNETVALPTGFYADLVVDPAFPDANVTIVRGTAEYAALDASATGAPVGVPFQVRCTGGATLRTVHFKVQNIRAVDDSWTGGSGCSAASFLFTEMANTSDTPGTAFSGFPQSFDSTTFPPTNWTTVAVDGSGGAWARSTATVHPSSTGAGSTPHSGAGLAYFNSWTVAAGNSARLGYQADTNTSTYPLVGMSFWMFHDTMYSTHADYVQPQISTDAGATWASVGSKVYRYAATKAWTQSIQNLSSVAGGKAAVRVGLLGMSDYGNDEHIDDVSFFQLAQVADSGTCAGTPALSLANSNYGYGYWLYDPQCNNNGYADTGDTGTLLVYLTNTGNETAYGVTATLTCPSCPAGVNICKSTATYGDIPYSSGYNYSQPDNGFQVSIPTGLTAATALPWVVTATATNPYSTTITVPSNSNGQSRSGTYDWVSSTDPYSYSIADYFTTIPSSGASNAGRYGFTGAWTTTSGVTKQTKTGSTDPLGLGYACRITGKSSTSPQTMAHTFTTAAVNGTINNYWIFNIGRAATDSTLYIDYTNDGTNWYPLVKNGIAGAAAGADSWTTYGYFSAYLQIYNQTGTGYGPTAAAAMLKNPNFGIRFRAEFLGSSNTYWEISPFWLDYYTWTNTATSCTGACLGPEAAVVSEVRDVDPCALSGVKVFFDKGINTVSTALYKDGVSAVPGYTSGTTYAPGDSTSHNYTIRATNTTGSTDSAATAGTDAIGTGTPTFACTPGTCTDPTSVLLTTQSGYSNYQWYRNGSSIGGATSNTYTATQSGSYTVAYKLGGCTNLSSATPVTIGGATNPPAVPNGSDVPGTPFKLVKNGSNVDATWDSSCINDTDYRILWGDRATLSLVSGVTNGTVTSATCSLGTSGSASGVTSPTDFSTVSCYFAVIDAVNGSSFGRHGNNTAGNERVLSGDTTFCGATTKNTTATTCQ